jgi:hypothetical protein
VTVEEGKVEVAFFNRGYYLNIYHFTQKLKVLLFLIARMLLKGISIF